MCQVMSLYTSLSMAGWFVGLYRLVDCIGCIGCIAREVLHHGARCWGRKIARVSTSRLLHSRPSKLPFFAAYLDSYHNNSTPGRLFLLDA